MRQHVAALRMLIVLSVILGVGYPLFITLVAQIPGLQSRADGSQIKVAGNVVGSKIIGQSFTDKDGNPLVQYFQSRPSAAGDGYDPTASSASNLGPESIVDTLPDPSVKGDTGKQSLLTQVCSRSLAIGKLEGVDGSRPFCTPDGVGAVLAVFWSGPGYHGHVTRVVSLNQTAPAKPFLATYKGVPVELAKFGDDYSKGQVVPIRGNAPSRPVVPADAVTASGSGLDPEISPAYARLQEARVAKARGVSVAQVAALVDNYKKGRDLGFLGEPRVNVLQLNIALDKTYPYHKG
ncbi:MAG TPA: potassium-transporting ATPase subunit C [Jatrophihabitantaceae bacterium]|nr:potassium-transporting ATPase subunit C [Jatrophihabitantaceae bacterium]